MQEAAKTVEDIGLVPHMAAATAQRQHWMATLAARGVFSALRSSKPDWREYADSIIAAQESGDSDPRKWLKR